MRKAVLALVLVMALAALSAGLASEAAAQDIIKCRVRADFDTYGNTRVNHHAWAACDDPMTAIEVRTTLQRREGYWYSGYIWKNISSSRYKCEGKTECRVSRFDSGIAPGVYRAKADVLKVWLPLR